MNYYSIDRCRPCLGAASIFLDKLLYGNSYFLSDGVLAYVVKGPLRIFNFKYEPDIYTQEISQQICVYMKYLFTLLMACLSLSTTYGTVHHPSSSGFVRTMGGLGGETCHIMAGCICHRQWSPRDDGEWGNRDRNE